MRSNEEIVTLIDEKRKEKGMSISELARKVGMAKSGVSRYFNRTRAFPLDRADEFAKALGMETSDLLGVISIEGGNNGVVLESGDNNGDITITNNDIDTEDVEHGQKKALKSSNALLRVQEEGGDVRSDILSTLQRMEKTQKQILNAVKNLSTSSETHTEPLSNFNDVNEELHPYHVYERLSAGMGATVYDDKDFDTVYFDKEISHDFASWIWGDSMEPAYQNGEVALIKETGFDYDGAVYAVVWDGQTYIKKVYKESDGLRLESINSKYSDKFAPFEEEPRVIGLVVGHFTPLEK